MENHPIPQDVTGFQFKLIGSMTVKQFGFIAAGVVPAVIFYYSPLPIFLKFILIPIFGLTGVAMAFLPIEGRPMDVMIANFFKAIFSPNQYMFEKQGLTLAVAHLSLHAVDKKTQQAVRPSEQMEKQQQLTSYLQSQHATSHSALDEKENSYLSSIFGQTTQNTSTHIQPIPMPQHISPPQQSVIAPISHKPIVITRPIAPVTPPTQQTPQTTAVSTTPHPEPQKPIAPKQQEHPDILKEQIEILAKQKATLEKQLAEFSSQLKSPLNADQEAAQQIAGASLPSQSPDATPPDAVPTLQQAVLSSKDQESRTTTDVPNIVSGIIKDARGNFLPNILVDITDSKGGPVRAFKSNQMGQFATATPLSAGVYSLTFEDPQKKHRFETIELTVNNSVIPPMLIVSHDDREELRKALFS